MQQWGLFQACRGGSCVRAVSGVAAWQADEPAWA